MNDKISNLSPQEISHWLRTYCDDFKEAAEKFEKLGISGEVLVTLKQEDLEVDFGVELTASLWPAIQNLISQSSRKRKLSHDSAPPKKQKMERKNVSCFVKPEMFTLELRKAACVTNPKKFLESPYGGVDFLKKKGSKSKRTHLTEGTILCSLQPWSESDKVLVRDDFGREFEIIKETSGQYDSLLIDDIESLNPDICPIKLSAVYHDIDRTVICRSFRLILYPMDSEKLSKKTAVKGILRRWLPGSEVRDDLADLFLTEDVAQIILEFLPEVRPDLMTNNEGTTMYSTTGSFVLDAFANVVPTRKRGDNSGCHTPELPQKWRELFTNAWNEDPMTTLRVMFHLGAVRDGKSDNYNFYHALLWLFDEQPATLLANLHLIPEVSYYKGLLELCARIVEGDERSFERDTAMQKKIGSKKKIKFMELKKIPKVNMAHKALSMFDHCPKYRAVHTRAAQIFAEALRKDAKALEKNNRANISLAAKWCPSSGSSYDKRTLIFESIARLTYPQKIGEAEGAYSRRCQKDLRKLLTKLRERLRVCEKMMSQDRWGDIRYEGVPSVCMKNNSKNFEKHDGDRFSVYLADVAAGKKDIKARVVLPDQIMQKARAGDETERQVAELQWRSLVQKLKEEQNEKLLNTLCVLDPCKPASIALAILFAQLNEGYYKGKLLDFTPNPQEFSLVDDGIANNANHVSRIGCSTLSVKNLLKTVLKTGVRNGYVPSRIFIFTCMNFTAVGGDGVDWDYWEKLYFDSGYTIPQIVHWNTQAQKGAPILKNEKHSCVVSGYSPNLIKNLLKSGSLDPIDMMFDQLDKEVFRKLTIIGNLEEAKKLFESVLLEELSLEVVERLENENPDITGTMDTEPVTTEAQVFRVSPPVYF